jgi:hypothetical protein
MTLSGGRDEDDPYLGSLYLNGIAMNAVLTGSLLAW